VNDPHEVSQCSGAHLSTLDGGKNTHQLTANERTTRAAQVGVQRHEYNGESGEIQFPGIIFAIAPLFTDRRKG
jgi:hypothetical protein